MEDEQIELTRDSIDPEKYYSPNHLMRCNIFPWFTSVMTLMSILKSEKGQELFKPVTKTGPANTRYYIKGENVIEVLRLADAGELNL